MNNKKLKPIISTIGLLLVVTVLVFVVVANQQNKTPLQEVEGTLIEIQQELNKEKVDAFMGYIADDYSDNKGFNKAKIKKELDNFKVIYQNFNVKTLESRIKIISSREAEVDLKVQLTAGIKLLGQQEKMLNIRATMQKKNDAWVISRSEWNLEIQPANQGLN